MNSRSRFVDLSQAFADGMPGVRRRQPDGSYSESTVRLRVTRTRQESAAANQGKAGFESTEVAFPTAIATYIDAPYCRYAEMRDISRLELEDVILPGLVVDCRGAAERQVITVDAL